MTNLQSMAYALSNGKGITLGNLCFLNAQHAQNCVEVPIKELTQAGYEETLAYTTDEMPEKKELFVDYVLNHIKKQEM